MKRIINWFLLLGTIISAGVALKFSALPVPAFLPDSWAEFWISSAEEQQRYVLLYDIAVDSKEETEQYRNDRESGAFLQYAIDLQSKQYNTALANPTAIISGSKYTTNILVSQLKRKLTASYISIDDVEVDKLNTFKYVVFIVDSSTKDTITDILNANEITSNILLLTEQGVSRLIPQRHNVRTVCLA